MKNAYLSLAIVGTVIPYFFFTQFWLAGDTSLGAFTTQLFVTAPAAGFTSDLLVTSLAFWVWSFHEARTFKMSRWWAYVLLNLAIGLSCAFPLFLYMRARRVNDADRR